MLLFPYQEATPSVVKTHDYFFPFFPRKYAPISGNFASGVASRYGNRKQLSYVSDKLIQSSGSSKQASVFVFTSLVVCSSRRKSIKDSPDV